MTDDEYYATVAGIIILSLISIGLISVARFALHQVNIAKIKILAAEAVRMTK